MVAGISDERGTIAIVTVNWNNWRYTLKCLAALERSVTRNWHLYVVDNASTDDSLTRLRAASGNFTLIANNRNAGWAGGNNLGIRRAIDAGHEFILLLNNDAFVRPDTLCLLREAFEGHAPARPVLGPIHRGIGSAQYDFVAARDDAWSGIPYPLDADVVESEALLQEPLIESAYIVGAALFAHRDHFQAAGLMHEPYFLNYEEVDWCRRVRSKGYPLYMVPRAVVDHVGSVTLGGRTLPLQTYFHARNMQLFAERNTSPRQRLRNARRSLHGARRLAPGRSRLGWLLAFLSARDGQLAAYRRGIADYVLRRFGDCPPKVRDWHMAALTQEERQRVLQALHTDRMA